MRGRDSNRVVTSLRDLAVTSPERSPFLPDVPAMVAAGVDNCARTEEKLWCALIAPKGLPTDLAGRLST
nr:tripartite tricarboxylate transporter substrate-binding protein [Pollutimonas subterranea]